MLSLLQNLTVAIVVLAAAAYLVRRALRFGQPSRPCAASGCHGCGGRTAKPLVTLHTPADLEPPGADCATERDPLSG